ncbi:hypothetical protein NAPIS_ORF00191 [Vairimorpha apis BRL 01]|uniref:Uncharacterized protein n=1 Tax=Vairimorpha apis BRL 01 TaxID=1037528 RepID=T0LD61_9MICR|nr:hypothetical protein NAPIS_ORF00191 [Vairimorpha apis BRL 01]
MEIIDILETIIKDLSSLKPQPQPLKPNETFIPSFKLDDVKLQLKNNLVKYLISTMNTIGSKQSLYDNNYKSQLDKRKNFVIEALKQIELKINNINVEKIKNLLSQIDFYKQQGNNKIDQIFINKETSLKILEFLSNINIENEYPWMEDFLKRKIIFDMEIPSAKEIEIIKKMLEMIKNFSS